MALNAGDRNDTAAAPDERLRFNLVYADRFSPGAEATEIGGLFGSDADHTKGWGTLMLEDSVGLEVPAPIPEWLTWWLARSGQPDRRRLRLLAAGEMDIAGRAGGWATVELAYPGLDGKEETGQARLFLPPALRDDPARRVSLIHAAGYEVDENGAAPWLAKGYAVSTPHAHPLNPLGRGVGLDRAILHTARGLPFVRPGRVAIMGGSAGGWMTLMLAAETFPLVWAMPDVPPIHWGYNADYIARHQAMAAAPAGSDRPRLPVLLAVGPIAEQSRTLYGMPYESEAFLSTSPLAHLETITAPTQVTFSTADMLVPIDQVGNALVRPWDAEAFPEGFSTAMSERFPGAGGSRTLLEALPPERYALLNAPTVGRPSRLRPDGSSEGKAGPLTLPFSGDKTWSIVVIDEGPVEPEVGHFKYHWTLDREPFRRWAESQGIRADQLTGPKLERLMRRLQGEPWRPFRARPGGQGEEIVAGALDFPEAERADALLGLTAFAEGDTCALRLARLYRDLPTALKVFGERLGDGTAAEVRTHLKSLTAAR
ncbi:MAG: hypothetical protein IT210_06845 [Armatimonadetes bacterium]|nr:hypothetical protein [Armatimonadota bacterium]